MANMSYCRYENTSRDLADVVNALYDSYVDVDLDHYETRGLESILELSKEVVRMEDKINNILENQEEL